MILNTVKFMKTRKYGTIELSLIGNNVYEMYDSTTDEYYGTIEGTNFNSSIIENKIDEYRMNLFNNN